MINQLIEYEGYTPFEYQSQVHEAITKHVEMVPRFTPDFKKIFVVKAMRQVGKTVMNENELSRFAIDFDKSTNWFVAPSFELATKVYNHMVKAYEDTNIVKHYNSTKRLIALTNDSEIHFKSAEQGDNLRGESINGLLCIDEAAFIKDYMYYSVLKPMVNFHKAVTLITSTPKFLSGFFSDLYHKGVEGSKYIESFDFCDFDTSHVLPPEELEDLRRTLDETTFRNEYLGLFSNAESHVFGNFKKNILPDEFTPRYKFLYGGLDFATGSGKDETSLSLLNEKGEQCYLKKWKTENPTDQVDQIVKFLVPMQESLRVLMVELNGIGKVYFDMLRKATMRSNIKLDRFTTTNESKRELVEETNQAFGQMELFILNDDQLIEQLQFFQSKFNKRTNKVSYEAATGYHDDDVISLMLSNKARKKFRNPGKNYRFIVNN